MPPVSTLIVCLLFILLSLEIRSSLSDAGLLATYDAGPHRTNLHDPARRLIKRSVKPTFTGRNRISLGFVTPIFTPPGWKDLIAVVGHNNQSRPPGRSMSIHKGDFG